MPSFTLMHPSWATWTSLPTCFNGSSIEGGEPTVNCSHGSHGDKDYEHPSSEHDHGATTLLMRAASEGAILEMAFAALLRLSSHRRYTYLAARSLPTRDRPH